MLMTFPGLLTYVLLAPFILRVALGGYLILGGLRKLREEKLAWNSIVPNLKIGKYDLATVLAYIQVIVGIFVVIGLFTQIAVIITLIYVWFEWYRKSRNMSLAFSELWITVFVTVISISLLFTGAGFLAFDLPL